MRRKFLGLRLYLIGALVFFSAFPAGAATLEVGKGKKYQYQTIEDALDAAVNGDIIKVAKGSFDGATVDKAVTIEGTISSKGKLQTTIKPKKKKSGQVDVGFLFVGQSGNEAVIKNFKFQKVAYPVYGMGADNVTVDNNTLVSPIQGVTNWNGADWKITKNLIQSPREVLDGTRAKGGNGIVVGTGSGSLPSVTGVEREATGNKISFNVITGKVKAQKKGTNERAMAAIALVDNGTLDLPVQNNSVDNNTISLRLQQTGKSVPAGVKLQGIFLNETATTLPTSSVLGNTIGQNEIWDTGVRGVDDSGYRDVVQGEPAATEEESALRGGIAIEDALAEKPLLTGVNTYLENETPTGTAIPAPTVEAEYDISPF